MFDFEKYKGRLAIITDNNKKYTYKTLYNMQVNLSNYIQKRELIIILCENKIGCLVGYIFCIMNKVVPIMLDSNITFDILDEYLKKYHPAYLWIPVNNKQFNNKEVVYCNFGYKLIEYETNRSIRLNDALALLLTTSGSTGSPKLVRISYDNLISNTKSIIDFLGINEKESEITSLPFNYTYGLSVINTHLYTGACILLTDKNVVSKEFWNFFIEYNGTSFSGVPYTYEVLKKLNFFNKKIPSLKTMTQAGGAMSEETIEYFYNYSLKSGIQFFVMYGQTEATARMSILPFENMKEKIGSIGLPIKGGTIELIDEKGEKIYEANRIGEILYKGRNVSLGYAFSKEDLNKGDENQGLLHTGDLAYLDREGFIFICGRKDRFIKILGHRIDLHDLEKRLKVQFCCDIICFLYQNKIYIATNSNDNSIKKYTSRITGINKNCFELCFISEIPINCNGKVDYKKIRFLCGVK